MNKPVRIFSFLCLIGFIVGAVAGNWRYFLDYVGLVLLAVALHDALAFGTGYACARLSGLPDYDRRAVSIEVSYGLAQGLGQFGFLFLGLQLGMTAGMASVVMQTQAFFTLLLAAPLLGERAKPWQWGGLVAGVRRRDDHRPRAWRRARPDDAGGVCTHPRRRIHVGGVQAGGTPRGAG